MGRKRPTPEERVELGVLMRIYPHTPEQRARYDELIEKAMYVSLPVKILFVIIQGMEIIPIHINKFLRRRIGR